MSATIPAPDEVHGAGVMPAPADDQLQQDPSRQPHEPVDPHEPSDAVAQAFDQVCSRLGGFDDVIHTEWVDGYLTALAASWRVIGLDEALPLMCGDAFERAFADPPDAALARAALQARLDELRVQLDPEALLDDADRLRLAPMMVLWDDTARQEVIDEGLATEEVAAQLHTGASWAVGFFRALDDFADDWPEPGRDIDDELVEVYESLLETVAILEDDPDSEPFRAFAAEGWTDANPTREELVNEACFAVQDLRIWWMDHRPKRAPLRAAAVPGRNDPCPCGSGKKYKKCCGA